MQEEKGITEDELVGWHHCLDRHECFKLRELVVDRKAWHAAFYGVTMSQTWLSDLTDGFLFGGTFACVLVGGGVSHLSEGQQCPVIGFGLSIVSLLLWTVLSALVVIDTSISEVATKRLSQHIVTAASPLFVPGSLPKFPPPGPALRFRSKFARQGLV